MYEQLIQPNTNITWVNEECLMDVREAFGVGAKYPSAMANWNANSAVNHAGTPPSNIAVPIFFSIPTIPDGHVCLWDNGMIYTSSAQGKQIFTSIQALINWMHEGFVYLGWSEEIESTPVVKLVPTQTYTVVKGDTLSSIAERFGLTLAEIEAKNPQITNPNLIYPGQVINV